MAARTAAYGKAAYRWRVKRGALSINPFVSLPVTPTLKREREPTPGVRLAEKNSAVLESGSGAQFGGNCTHNVT
jgi:hypothetical protein